MPETIITGAFNAIKKPPEWLGKKTVDLYDTLRFPKLTTEEQKMKDKLHATLKKNYKAVGWVETGIGASLVTASIIKGYRRFKKNSFTPPALGEQASDKKFRSVYEQTHTVESGARVAEAVSEALNALKDSTHGIDAFEREKFGDTFYNTFASLSQLPEGKVIDVARAFFQEAYGRILSDDKIMELINLRVTRERQIDLISKKIMEFVGSEGIPGIVKTQRRIFSILAENHGPAKPPEKITADWIDPVCSVIDNVEMWAKAAGYPGIGRIGINMMAQ